MSGDLLVRQVDSELQHFLPKLLHVIAGGALKMHVAASGASLLKQNTTNATEHHQRYSPGVQSDLYDTFF